MFHRFGTKAELIRKLATFCPLKEGYLDVLKMCESYIAQNNQPIEFVEADGTPLAGYVYLYKHGSRREYKIGKTVNPLRRDGELRIELPERIKPVHSIETDDPSGVEAYWHRRFAEKRMQGEGFALSAEEVRAFKRWKNIH
jgi:hypothetical protein